MAALSQQLPGDVFNASEPIFEDITRLCDFCIKLTEAMVLDRGPNDCLSEIMVPTGDAGLQTCRLCEITTKYIPNQRKLLQIEGHPSTVLDWRSIRSTCVRRVYKNCLVSDETGPHQICGIMFRRVFVDIWADKDSPASAVLIDRPPILGPHMNRVCDLAQRWRRECNDHKDCTLEADAQMPTRVLALCGDDTQPSVQLIETKGQKGRYIALSHCWGPSEKQPIRTTLENYLAHQRGIKFRDLPKTFRDTAEFARGCGIKYIWIDSLCIIQGNSQDWHSEAAKMGAVYRNAALVLAAAGAKDSSEGLFISERPISKVLRLPYRVGGECKGTFSAVLLTNRHDRIPVDGPLNQRAWTLQERCLARRSIAFMPSCVSWICTTGNETETGESFCLFNSERRWSSVLREYTKRSLTFASDRVEALRGIAELYQNWEKGRYIPEYGVWEEDLVFQLLWFKNGLSFDDGRLADMPSWSWAATESAKAWPLEGCSGVWNDTRSAKEMLERLVITSTGHLEISGHLSVIQPAPSYVKDEFTARDLMPRELESLYDWSGSIILRYHLLVQDINNTYDKAVLGIVRFDDDKKTTYTHAFFLVKQERAERYRRGPNPFLKREFIDDVVYHTEEKIEFAYWALLLEQVDENKFRRVGMATLSPFAYEAFQPEVREFEIV